MGLTQLTNQVLVFLSRQTSLAASNYRILTDDDEAFFLFFPFSVFFTTYLFYRILVFTAYLFWLLVYLRTWGRTQTELNGPDQTWTDPDGPGQHWTRQIRTDLEGPEWTQADLDSRLQQAEDLDRPGRCWMDPHRPMWT